MTNGCFLAYAKQRDWVHMNAVVQNMTTTSFFLGGHASKSSPRVNGVNSFDNKYQVFGKSTGVGSFILGNTLMHARPCFRGSDKTEEVG